MFAEDIESILQKVVWYMLLMLNPYLAIIKKKLTVFKCVPHLTEKGF